MITKKQLALCGSLLAICGGSAFAQNTTWFYGGGADTIGNYGVTASEGSKPITWEDNFGLAGSERDPKYGTPELQVNQDAQLTTPNEGIALFGFGGITIDPADILTATLYIQPSIITITDTLFIGGTPASENNWDTNEMTFIDYAAGTPWSGGNLIETVNDFNFGSVTITEGSTAPVAIDITNALVAYLNGAIGGIALYTETTVVVLDAGTERIVFGSNDNLDDTARPGLLVEAVPEPSTLFLLLSSGLLLLSRRRRQV